MRTDLDDLLAGSAGDPTEPIDVDALWTAGRRRRALRRLAAAGGGVASIAVVAVVVGVLDLGGPATPEVAPLDTPGDAEPSETIDEDEADDEAPAEPGDAPVTDDPSAPPSDDDTVTDDDAASQSASDDEERGDEVEASEEPAPTPDAAAVADPCAAHRDREMEAFVEVVAPVTGQDVSDQVELVGCSSVYEGTVRYRVRSGDTVLADGFTTATAGGPEIGEFRETIDLDATGELVLEVFWESPADGSEQDLTTIVVQAS